VRLCYIDSFNDTLYRLYEELGCGRKDVVGLQSIRWVVGAKNLPLLALPLGLVDGINVILDFHHDAPVLFDYSRATGNSLGRLDGKRA
jgi:hypothetical protein